MLKRMAMLAGVAALGLGASACQQEPEVEPAKLSGSEDEADTDKADDDGAPKGAAAALANAEEAAEEASEEEARTLVSTIYNSYNSATPLHFVDDAAAMFEPELARGLTQQAAEAEANDTIPPALGGDPICGCQDWDNLSHTIDTLSVDGQKAVARLTVTNFGEPSARVLDLVKTPAGWRIFDIDGEFRSLVL